MKTLQEIISEMKDEISKAKSVVRKAPNFNLVSQAYQYGLALEIYVPKLELLLSDKHTEAITEEAHFANTMLGEVCPYCKRPTSETYRASSSETAVVGQNLGELKDGGTTDGSPCAEGSV